MFCIDPYLEIFLREFKSFKLYINKQYKIKIENIKKTDIKNNNKIAINTIFKIPLI